MKWLTLCPAAWMLYDFAVATGRWRRYLRHRRECALCRVVVK